MEPLAFVASRVEDQGVDLAPCTASAIDAGAWDEFAACVAREPSLISYPGCVFRGRWERGSAAVAVHDGHIVSYTSLEAAYDATFREQLAATWRHVNGSLPPIDLYEFATGWTDPAWRRNDVNLALRRELLSRFCAPHMLCVGVTLGLGAAPVLTRLGWSVLAWSQIAYLSSLIAVPLPGHEDGLGTGWLFPGGLRLYEGSPLTYAPHAGHPWGQFCHFWVARAGLARTLDERLCASAGGELAGWRNAIVRARTAVPAPFWKLSFYKE
jgi:hypothetical protein